MLVGRGILPLALGLLLGSAACALPGSDDPRWCDQQPRSDYRELERIPVSDDWFQVYRVEPGVFAIYEPYQFQEVISYLIEGSESALLFDTGMGISRIGALVRELTVLPVRVLNSHSHFDHVGGNAEFETVLGLETEFTRRNATGVANDEVAPGLDREILRGQVEPEALCRPLPRGLTAERYRIEPFGIARVVRDGDTVDLGGRTLEIIGAPGHTPDAVALLDRGRSLLWTGDSFYEGPIWLFAPGTDLEAYARTLGRLAGLADSVRRVLGGHNTPVASPARLRGLERAFGRVRSGRVSPAEREGGTVEYWADGYRFLLAAPAER